ncbi:MAG: hypothetical protein Q8O82_14340 [Pseudorhodobacter sp.]|nr:hypothetical protein [Pseudorhodobacter sp.]
MPQPTFTFASGTYDRLKHLHNGNILVEGCNIAPVIMKPELIFPRALLRQEFDITEMSASSYLMQTARGDSQHIAIPVFISRAFRHRCIYIRKDRGIRTPKDLEGKRLGVPEYQTTVSLWLRGILQDYYDVDISSIRYRNGGLNDPGRKERLPLDLPDKMDVEQIASNQTLSGLLEAGDLDAVIGPNPPSCFVQRSPYVKRMFEDYPRNEAEYFRDTGFFPIMHMIAIRKQVVEQHSWLPEALFRAFCEAKKRAFEEIGEAARRPANATVLPWLLAELERTEEIMGRDYWKYGVDPNRAELETLCRYSHEQHLAPRRLSVEELFAPQTLELFEQ